MIDLKKPLGSGIVESFQRPACKHESWPLRHAECLVPSSPGAEGPDEYHRVYIAVGHVRPPSPGIEPVAAGTRIVDGVI
jgi:hypothetical protein